MVGRYLNNEGCYNTSTFGFFILACIENPADDICMQSSFIGYFLKVFSMDHNYYVIKPQQITKRNIRVFQRFETSKTMDRSIV